MNICLIYFIRDNTFHSCHHISFVTSHSWQLIQDRLLWGYGHVCLLHFICDNTFHSWHLISSVTSHVVTTHFIRDNTFYSWHLISSVTSHVVTTHFIRDNTFHSWHLISSVTSHVIWMTWYFIWMTWHFMSYRSFKTGCRGGSGQTYLSHFIRDNTFQIRVISFVTWLIHMCKMTYLRVWHFSFICVTSHSWYLIRGI